MAVKPIILVALHLFVLTAQGTTTDCDAIGSLEDLFSSNATLREMSRACESALCTYRAQGHNAFFVHLRSLCEKYRSQNETEECLSLVEKYEADVKLIVPKLNASDSDVCKYYFGYGKPKSSLYTWQTSINDSELVLDSSPDAKEFSVLHLTDTHVAPNYAVGSQVDCKGYLCCTNKHPLETVSLKSSAGPFGDSRYSSKCDIPQRTLKSLLANAKQRKPDFVYLTGDFLPHTTVNYTLERIISEIGEQTQMILDAFAESKIVPCFGNHDILPYNMLPTHKMLDDQETLNRYYEELWRIWSPKLIPADQEKTFKRGGYFSVSVSPKLRVFSLNTVFCSRTNLWLLVDPKDPEDQLEWLAHELELSAKRNEAAHIIGHIPPGSSACFKEWSREYQKVVSRYRRVITGQFFGHNHRNMFTVDSSLNGTLEATGVQFTGPSASTWDTGFPSYRILTFNRHMELVEIDTYHLNTTKLNEEIMKPFENKTVADLQTLADEIDQSNKYVDRWELAFRMKDYFRMIDLSTKSFQDLASRLAKDDNLLRTFYRTYNQFHDELSVLNCSAGHCVETFGLNKGKTLDIICELNSYGSPQRDECEKNSDDYEPDGSNHISMPSLIVLFFSFQFVLLVRNYCF